MEYERIASHQPIILSFWPIGQDLCDDRCQQ